MKKILGERFCVNHPLAPLTSLKMGGISEFWGNVHDLEELRKIVTLAKSEGIRVRILGKGTNLVIQDGLLRGIILQLGGILGVIKRSEDRIKMGAGCPLSLLLREAINASLGGVEVLAGIPGTLGGAVTINAGTDLGSLSDLVDEVDIFDEGKIETWSAKKVAFTYRGSGIGKEKIVLGAKLKLKPGIDVKDRIKKALQKRWSSQPYRERSAGCVFQNPNGHSAGKLIDEAGLKGYRFGKIEISRKHANFFINLGGGTSNDFVQLMNIVQKKVFQMFGLELKPEVKFWMNEDEE
jgi:UDP-N-acetylmuramate dehydrogenase